MLRSAALPFRDLARWQRGARSVHVSSSAASVSSTSLPLHQADPVDEAAASPDARFQVLGTPFSLLSVSLAASQTLYTRRGTLVALSGKAENTLSTLSFLKPLRRAPFGIPFLYQKVSATSPIVALVSTRLPVSSIVSISLDGRLDWVVAQRQALLAWTGHTLNLAPQYNVKLGLAHWGSTYVTGRGLMALAGKGQIYQVQVKAGENYVAHPSNIVAYAVSSSPPLPFRFKSSNFRLQVPDLGFGTLLQRIELIRTIRQTSTWRVLASAYHLLKTWTQRIIWADRLFLRFQGPTTVLLQSHAFRPSDALTLEDVDEIARSPPGLVEDTVMREMRDDASDMVSSPRPSKDQENSRDVLRAKIADGRIMGKDAPS